MGKKNDDKAQTDLLSLFGTKKATQVDPVEDAGYSWTKRGFQIPVAVPEEPVSTELTEEQKKALESRLVQQRERDFEKRYGHYKGTWYCRHCETIFTGIPTITNHDPMKAEKWDYMTCPGCGGHNPFIVFPLECEHERREGVTKEDLHKREHDGIIFCKSFGCYAKRDGCEVCIRYRPTGFQRKRFRQFLEQRNEKIIEKVE